MRKRGAKNDESIPHSSKKKVEESDIEKNSMRKRGAENDQSVPENKKKKVEESEIESGVLGIIESVSLCNFMCHENLQFEFGPHINFIIGKNGSGKSAILTGIILALGGKSNATGRYNNIKGFVQNGKQKAKLQVTLKNCGEQAYKPEVYGSKVIVIREINLDGVSSYKLKSASGKIVSTHKEELTNVLNAMDIQIENPVSALTQENSKSFLTCKKPDQLYQYFYKGSGLETLEQNYALILSGYDDAQADLQRKKQILPVMEKELKDWKRILDTSAKVHDYNIELLWATVIELERRLKSKIEEQDTVQRDLNLSIEQRDDFKERLILHTANLDKYTKERDTCDAVMTDIRNKLKVLNDERDSLTSDVRMLSSKLSSLERDEAIASEEKTRLENSINENTLSDQNALNEEKMRREAEMQNLEAKIQNINIDLGNLIQDKEKQLQLQMDLTNQLQMLENDINTCSYSLQAHMDSLSRLENGVKNKVNVFGAQTQNILNEINRQKHRFSQLPKGPIGTYLEVKDSKWCAAVEECISIRLLNGYCCDNVRDSLVLSEILRRFCPQYVPTILITKYVTKVHDISKYRARTDFPTVFDMLRISDPVIANVLIDNCNIESKVLIEDVNAAVSAMVKNPKNCSGAYLKDCSSIVLNPYRFYSNEKVRRPLLSSVGRREIMLAKQDIEKYNENHIALLSQKNSLLEQINQIPGSVNILDRKIIQFTQSQQKIRYAIEDLRMCQDPRDTHCMQEDLQQLQREHDKITDQLENCKSLHKEKNHVYQGIVEKIRILKEALQEERKKYFTLCSELNICGEEKEKCGLSITKLEKKIDNCKNLLEPIKKEVEKITKLVQIAVRNAEKVGPRRETTRNCEDLERLLAETEKVVKEQSNCNRDELRQKYKEKVEKYNNVRKDLSVKENVIESIYKMYKQRKKNFSKICSLTQHYIEYVYSSHLNRLFTGKLIFDNKKRTLSLEAIPNKSNSEEKKRGGKCSSLSGGERSFITIAFLLALWDRITSPFKILDEYDVFMDSNNRNLSISLLTEQAEAFKDTQFIFLSPLELPEIKDSPLIKIHQMQEPQRDEMGVDS